jgi:hypothetical protein
VVQRTFAQEADYCRGLAEEVDGQADKAFLHRIAGEFDRLADIYSHSDQHYYAARAAQEVSAAVKAQHPKARLAHLMMARRYDALLQGTQPH